MSLWIISSLRAVVLVVLNLRQVAAVLVDYVQR
jgi:hypothetical protein